MIGILYPKFVLHYTYLATTPAHKTAMPYNRIAIYGHRGWAGSAIADALMASGAPITVLHRASSDTSCIASGVRKIQVDVDDHEALIAALQDIDIVM